MKARLSLLAFALAALSLVFLVISKHLFAIHPTLIAIQVGAALLMIWARVTFGIRSFHAAANTSKGRLVTHGPYRYWRHPIYASIIYFVWAGQLESITLSAMAAACVATAALIVRMFLEEEFLTVAYPTEYERYAKHAKRLIPFVL